MGIVNVTPDSFSDGGAWSRPQDALAHCEQLLADGADVLDIGGESTRPGAPALPLDEELRRVLPVVREAVKLGVPISVDTYKPAVMRAVLDLGADIINDVWALRWSAAAEEHTAAQIVAQHPTCGVCLMHMHREPQTMQITPMVGDVAGQLLLFWKQQIQFIRGLGVEKTRICLDPGIGFGKTVAQNFSILAQQSALVAMGFPLLVGWSRKSSLAAVTQKDLSRAASTSIQDRVVPSVVAAVLAVQNGAHVVRVHDVRETVQGLRVWTAMQSLS